MKKLILLLLLLSRISFEMEAPRRGPSSSKITKPEFLSLLDKINAIIDQEKTITSACERVGKLLNLNNLENINLYVNNRSFTKSIKNKLAEKYPEPADQCSLFNLILHSYNRQREYGKNVQSNMIEVVNPYIDTPKTKSEYERIKEIFTENFASEGNDSSALLQKNVSTNELSAHNGVTIKLLRNEARDIIGFIAYKIAQPDLWTIFIEWLAIDKKYQKKGLGNSLIQYLTELASLNEFDRIYLQGNKNAIPFYEKLGFTRIKPNLDYFEKRIQKK